MFDDLRQAAKGLTKAPGFALTAIVTLALGIGANTLIFSLVYGVLLRPLPFDAPERLVAVPAISRSEAGDLPGGASVRAMDEWRETSKTLERPAIYRSVEYTVAGHGDPERADACLVSESFFDTLGTRPIAGRVLDVRDSDAPVAVLSHELWRRRFGASDPVGRTLRLDGRPHTIVGVMPHGFAFPSPTVALWIPRLSVAGEAKFPGVRKYEMVARLRKDATLDMARAEAAVISARLESSDSRFSKGVRASVERLEDALVGDVRRGLLVLFAGVIAVLLVACVNVGSLAALALVLVGVGLYANGSDMTTQRTVEIGVRMALGADGWATVRMLVVSGLAPVGVGLAAGLAAAVALSRVTASLLYGVRPTDPLTYVAATVLILAVAAIAIAGPARRAVRIDPAAALNRG